MNPVPTIRAGQVTAFFLYDVAEAIDLQRVRALIGGTVAARLNPKPTTPPYVQYQQPPLAADGDVVGVTEIGGFRVRFKIFDYGVISVALTAAVPPTWEELLKRGLEWQEDPKLPLETEGFCRRLVTQLRPALTAARDAFVAEDYFVFAVTGLSLSLIHI